MIQSIRLEEDQGGSSMESSNISSVSDLLRNDTLRKRQIFESFRCSKKINVPFWDIVVITAADTEQEIAYDIQLRQKLGRELPDCINYHVFADPVGPKIGSGGSTLIVLDKLEQLYGEKLDNYKVLLIHAGGYSQRLPCASVLGKIFTAVPVGDPLYQMIEIKFMMYVDFPSRMAPGVFVTCADDIELFTIDGDWDFKQPGFTALGHPSSIEVGTTHGVFVLTEEDAIKETKVSVRNAKCRKFLHKPTKEVMKSEGAIIDSDVAYTDSAYFVDRSHVKKLLKFYYKYRPIKCEIDAYGDFLQALGTEASIDYTTRVNNVVNVTEDLFDLRQNLFHLLKGTQLNVLLFTKSVFYHIGTITEYLHHYCKHEKFQYELGCLPTVMTSCASNLPKLPQVGRRCSIMHTRIGQNFKLLGESIIEYCLIDDNVTINSTCIIGNVHLLSNLVVPQNSFLHGVTIKIRQVKKYVTVAYHVEDNMKATAVDITALDKIQFAGKNMDYVISNIFRVKAEEIWPNCKLSLWHARLFPIFESRTESDKFAVELLNCMQKDQNIDLDKFPERVSMADILTYKDVRSILDYRQDVESILAT